MSLSLSFRFFIYCLMHPGFGVRVAYEMGIRYPYYTLKCWYWDIRIKIYALIYPNKFKAITTAEMEREWWLDK